MKTENKIRVVAIVGPTASGKTKLSVALAEKLNAEIISADSMQIYKGMDIATAKPRIEDMRGIKHHLIDFLSPSEQFDVVKYVSLAKQCIEDINSRGKLPLLCGGTGLYVDSLLNNIQFTSNQSDPCLRKELEEKAKQYGSEVLLRELALFDPESAERLHPNNVKRIIRAIEIYRTTGITMTEQLENSRKAPSLYDTYLIGLTTKNRQILYDRINRRVDQMIEDGLIEEARKVLASDCSMTAMNAIGYKELKPYFNGECKSHDAIEKIKLETRRYAKRQLTWLKRNKKIDWIAVDDYDSFDEIVNLSFELIQKNLREIDKKGSI